MASHPLCPSCGLWITNCKCPPYNPQCSGCGKMPGRCTCSKKK